MAAFVSYRACKYPDYMTGQSVLHAPVPLDLVAEASEEAVRMLFVGDPVAPGDAALLVVPGALPAAAAPRGPAPRAPPESAARWGTPRFTGKPPDSFYWVMRAGRRCVIIRGMARVLDKAGAEA